MFLNEMFFVFLLNKDGERVCDSDKHSHENYVNHGIIENSLRELYFHDYLVVLQIMLLTQSFKND